jgi:hypothetical protein
MDPKERDRDRANAASVFAPAGVRVVVPSNPPRLSAGAARALLRIVGKASAGQLGEDLEVGQTGADTRTSSLLTR